MGNAILINTRLQPGAGEESKENRFNGFPATGKPLKRLRSFAPVPTRLKPGVNEIGVHCGADLRVCCVAGFQTCAVVNYPAPADLEIGDTAGLSRKAGCATTLAESRKDN